MTGKCFLIFERYNAKKTLFYFTGTYNNQYMLIDLNKIHLGDVIDDGALWVVEQMPSLVVGGDQSAILRTGGF